MPQRAAILRRLNPLEWAGPIFTKELRVTSRRRRFYALRLLYLLVMAGFVGLMKFPAGESVRASVIGETIIRNIVWFEFIACQVLSVVLTCNAISSEITAGTLGVLMSTPIRPFQIVLGKLLSRLLHVFLLLAITLPPLAAIRVFGGVPWDAVVYSLVLIAVASLFVGSIAVFLSCRRFAPISVIILSLLIYGGVVFLPTLALGMGWILNPVVSLWSIWAGPTNSFHHVNMGLLGEDPGNAAALFLEKHYVPLNLAAMLGFSLLLLWRASRSLAKLALWAANQSPTSRVSNVGARPGRRSKVTRDVSGSAMLWKEMRFYVPDSRRKTIVIASIALAILVLSYVCSAISSVHYETSLHFLYLMLYLLGVWLVSLMLSCTAITVERESRALPILLTAPVSDGQIIWAKVASVLRRVGPLAALMLAHLVVFTLLPSINPMGLLYMALIAGYSTLFIISLGMYCSSLTRTSTASIVLALVGLLILWLAAPMVANVASQRLHDQWESNFFNLFNPLVQMSVMIVSTCGETARVRPEMLEYRWLAPCQATGNGAAGAIVLLSLTVHGLLSALMLWRATIRLRKNVFAG